MNSNEDTDVNDYPMRGEIVEVEEPTATQTFITGDPAQDDAPALDDTIAGIIDDYEAKVLVPARMLFKLIHGEHNEAAGVLVNDVEEALDNFKQYLIDVGLEDESDTEEEGEDSSDPEAGGPEEA